MNRLALIADPHEMTVATYVDDALTSADNLRAREAFIAKLNEKFEQEYKMNLEGDERRVGDNAPHLRILTETVRSSEGSFDSNQYGLVNGIPALVKSSQGIVNLLPITVNE